MLPRPGRSIMIWLRPVRLALPARTPITSAPSLTGVLATIVIFPSDNEYEGCSM